MTPARVKKKKKKNPQLIHFDMIKLAYAFQSNVYRFLNVQKTLFFIFNSRKSKTDCPAWMQLDDLRNYTCKRKGRVFRELMGWDM